MPRSIDKLKKYDEPLSTKEATELVEVSARTLIHYEKLGFVCPEREGKIRLYSAQDIKWLRCLRELIHGRNISLEVLRKLLKFTPCRVLKNCPPNAYAVCAKSPGKHFAAREAPGPGMPSSRTATASHQKRVSGNQRSNKA